MPSIARRGKPIFHLIATSLILLFLAACNGSNDSSNGETNDDPNALSAPATPTGFQAAPGYAQIQLQWNTVTNADSYTIYWSDAPSVDITTASNVDIIGGSVASEGLNWTVNGTTYYFVIVARNSAGASAPTAEISATPGEFLDAVTLLTADPAAYSVTLTWPAVAGADNYEVYRSTSPNVSVTDPSVTTFTGITVPPFTDDQVTSGTTYYYRMRARTMTDAAPLSNEISVTPGVRWQKVSYNPDLTGVAYGGGVYVAVGGNGALFKSVDGTSWTMSSSGTDHLLHDVTYGNGMFVVVGDSGLVLTSSDGTTWSRVYETTTDNLVGIDLVNGQFVAVGDGQMIYSSDGATWTATDPGNTTELRASSYGAGVYVLVGANGAVFSSADLSSWSAHPQASYNLTSVAFYNGKFIATSNTGDAIGSTNGSVWSTVSGLNSYQSIIAATDKWIAVGGLSKVATSTDGVSWSTIPFDPGYDLLDVVLGPDKIVAVGKIAKAVYSTDLTLAAWFPSTPGFAVGLNGITYNYGVGSELFVVVGDSGTLITSPDGTNWSAVNTGLSDNLHGATWGWQNPVYRYVVVGDSQKVLYSDDGSTWNNATLPGYVTAPNFSDAAFNNSVYVAVGSGGVIIKSSDGITWSNATVPVGYDTKTFRAVATETNQVFVAVTTDGKTVVSDINGDNWIEATHDVFANMSTVTYDNSGVTHKFVIAGDTKVMASADNSASSWSSAVSFGNSATVNSMVPYDSGLLAIGVGGMTALSSDGSTWSQRPSGLTPNFNDVVHTSLNSGTFFAVGENGLIATHGNNF